MTTTFTARDRARVDHGLLPIDVDPPRRLTRRERWPLFRRDPFGYLRVTLRLRRVPCVGSGFVYWARPDELQRWTEAA